jgi:hypothetical protein
VRGFNDAGEGVKKCPAKTPGMLWSRNYGKDDIIFGTSGTSLAGGF